MGRIGVKGAPALRAMAACVGQVRQRRDDRPRLSAGQRAGVDKTAKGLLPRPRRGVGRSEAVR